jgi:hypothetical protein
MNRREKMTIKAQWSTAQKTIPFQGITTHRIDQGNLTIIRHALESNSSFPLNRHLRSKPWWLLVAAEQ